MAVINQLNCTTTDVITGTPENCSWDIGAIAKVIFAETDQEFATATAAATAANWATDIQAKNVLPLPIVSEYEDKSEEDTYYTSPITSIDKFVREGKSKSGIKIEFDPDLYERLRGLNGTTKRFYLGDTNGHIIGTSPDGTKVKGVLTGTLRVGKWIQSDGSNPSFIPIHIAVRTGTERNDQIAVVKIDWDFIELNGVQPVILTEVGTSSGTTIVVDIAQKGDGVAVSGITEETDFIYLQADGTTEETVTVVAESATIPGRYTLTGVAFVTGGTINLRNVVDVGTYFYQGTAIDITFS